MNNEGNESFGCDNSFIDIPCGFAVGKEALHVRSNRKVILMRRELGDGWICAPINGDNHFYEHSKHLQLILDIN